MRTNDTATLSSGPSAEELTPLAVSQAALEGEENPNPARMITPQERAASGMAYADDRRQSRLARILLSPALLCGAAAIGMCLMVGLGRARRASHPRR